MALRTSMKCATLVVLIAANTILGLRLYSKEIAPEPEESAYDSIELFTRALEQIRRNYVDDEKTSYRDLIHGALQGMMQSLDEHSQFLDESMFEDMQEDTKGQFGGLGIVISIREGELTIVSPMEDTPGFRAGLMSGDRIMEIDGISTEGVTLPEAVKQLRGEPGTKVSLKILRPKNQDVRDVEIVRADIQVPSVKDTRMLDGLIGYTRITQFNEPTADSLDRELASLVEQGAQALVIDLRNNPGGLLSSAIEVSQKFLNRSDIIVSTQGRRDDQTYRARARRHIDLPMALLVNGGSASASEIVAGALQDHRRAVLVGEKTFGKGSVQSVLPLDDGSALRLTTAKYYTPSNRLIHERGIEPDIVVPMSPETWRDLLIQRAREENPEAFEGREEDFPAEPVVDLQLERAVDVLKGIMAYTAKR